METSKEFSVEEWDDCSDTSTIHLSFVIQTLLPVRLIGWKNSAAYKSYKKFQMENVISETDSVESIQTGSQAEGFGIPEALRRESITEPTPEIFSDMDVLLVIREMKFSASKIDEPSDKLHGYLDFDHTAPGYARICLLKMPKNPDMAVYDDETGKYCLRSSYLSDCMYSDLREIDADKGKTKQQQGPAVSIIDQSERLFFKNKIKPLTGTSVDLVPAFVCSPWPQQAKDWERRHRKSGWLQPHLVETIKADGCHVVGVPSKTSLKPDIEWRLSFSASEGRLAREAVTDNQRQCYIYLKILRFQIMTTAKTALSSYVFKSVFLHCCEKLPVSHWKEYPGNCVLYMLDVLLKCLHRKHVPTFFLPENNLIGHLNESEIQTAINMVEKLRSNPVSPVLDFADKRCLLMQPYIGTFRLMMTPVIEDMKQFKQHRNKIMSIKHGMTQSVVLNCNLHLREHASDEDLSLLKHQEAVKCLMDAYTQWLHLGYPGFTPASYASAYGLALKELKYCVRFFKAAVSMADEHPEFLQLRGNLACMLHASAYDREGEVNEDYLAQAGELFQEVYSETMGSTIDYVTYLLKKNEYEKAKEILEHFLKNGSSSFVTLYSYSEQDIQTVDNSLRRHIETNGIVTGNAVSFAYYYLVRCLCAKQQQDSTQVTGVLSKLEQHCKENEKESSFDFYSEAKKMAGM